jgi:drug/metabolite transporter (DMT)-like permease
MVLIGIIWEHPQLGGVSATGWLLLAYMTAVPMGLCYLSWFAALRRLRPASASAGTLLTPVIGVFAAAAVLGEPLGARTGRTGADARRRGAGAAPRRRLSMPTRAA